MDTSQQIIEDAKQKAIKKVEHASNEAKDLVLETAKQVEVKKQFELHEVEDQRRFDEQKKQIDRLFIHVSDTIGKTEDHIKNDKESHRDFMENLEKVKEDVGTLKTDVREVRTDIKWLRENAENMSREDKDDKNEMLTRSEFEPYKNIIVGIVATIGVSLIGMIMAVIYWVIRHLFNT